MNNSPENNGRTLNVPSTRKAIILMVFLSVLFVVYRIRVDLYMDYLDESPSTASVTFKESEESIERPDDEEEGDTHELAKVIPPSIKIVKPKKVEKPKHESSPEFLNQLSQLSYEYTREDVIKHYDSIHELREKDDTVYYNLGGDKPEPILSKYRAGGPVIASLCTNIDKDVKELQNALKSLKFLHGDDPNQISPVLVFNEGDLSQDQINAIVASTNRPIAFPLVDFTSFPPGFDPDKESREFSVKGRSKWGYYQMIRFWVTTIWKHRALAPYEIVMRIDTDSCFMEDNRILPNMPNEHTNYYSQYVGLEWEGSFVQGLYDWTTNWMQKTDKLPGNPLFWAYIQTSHELHGTLPLFRTNFEVSRKSFMQTFDVYRWFEAITEREPFGVFRHRWGDAVIRYLMAAIFATSEEIVVSRPDGYGHKEMCDVDAYAARYPWYKKPEGSS